MPTRIREYEVTTPFAPLKYNYTGKEGEINRKPTKKIEATVAFAGAALEEMKAHVESFISDTFPAKKAKTVVWPFKNKDGDQCLTFVTYSKSNEGEDRFVTLSDSKGNVVKRKDVVLGPGSMVRIKSTFTATEYEGKDYVKLWLNSIQVKTREEPRTSVRTPEGPKIGSGGFEAVEGGDDSWAA